ncbi:MULTISPECIES: cupin domain-containing protein [Psychrobacter]|uniref:cupin domain-containing protein n=1 Tax=Psychrobacter TaxID=497 RepID=UPI000EC33634|nr:MULTISPECIES: cupin domain-containing protein [Psychrobacter]HCT74883.1 cupin [Psychrobacter sp.]
MMTTPDQQPRKDTQAYVLTKSDIDNTPETEHVHQFNEHAIRHTVSLSDIVGLTKFGLHLVRVEAGDETTTHHYHEESDEFIYVLSGELSLRYGDEDYQLSAGDFVGFPAHGAAHSMRNESDADATYLMDGSRPPIDITLYPEINRKMYTIHGKKEYVDLKDLGEV